MLLWLQRASAGEYPVAVKRGVIWVDVFNTRAKLIMFTDAEAWICGATSTNH